MKDHGIAKLINFGQSVWYDFIKRDLLDSGELKRLIEEDGLRGMTSNPTIFEKAIAGSNLYDKDLSASKASDDAGRCEAVMVADVTKACDIFRPLFDKAGGKDGFVSIEVSPTAANDTKTTLSDAHRLWASVNRPNLMVKIPGTAAGLPAIRQCLAEGININVTLLFAVERYVEVAEAYIAGLEDRAKASKDISKVQSVASFFVSRVDSKADKSLGEVIAKGGPDAEKAKALLHTVAIDNAKVAYEAFLKCFSGARWGALAQKGAAVQRPLWASTSTKDPTLPDVMYVEALIGKDTVNTMPPDTYKAYVDHGKPAARITDAMPAAHKRLADLASLGIDLKKITRELEVEGVASFTKSFEALLTAVGQKSKALNVA
jgi:transaldolase